MGVVFEELGGDVVVVVVVVVLLDEGGVDVTELGLVPVGVVLELVLGPERKKTPPTISSIMTTAAAITIVLFAIKSSTSLWEGKGFKGFEMVRSFGRFLLGFPKTVRFRFIRIALIGIVAD
jgi:hypothetical protein